jgi:hypothetical protein
MQALSKGNTCRKLQKSLIFIDLDFYATKLKIAPIMDRGKDRHKFIIPLNLVDVDTHLKFKVVILNVSAQGLLVFTNDKRFLMASEDILISKIFDLDFDFFHFDTKGLKACIRNITVGENEKFERKLGLEFVDLDPKFARKLEEFLQEHHDS